MTSYFLAGSFFVKPKCKNNWTRGLETGLDQILDARPVVMVRTYKIVKKENQQDTD